MTHMTLVLNYARVGLQHLDTPLRVVLQLVPEKTIKFDGDSISKTSYDGSVPGQEA